MPRQPQTDHLRARCASWMTLIMRAPILPASSKRGAKKSAVSTAGTRDRMQLESQKVCVCVHNAHGGSVRRAHGRATCPPTCDVLTDSMARHGVCNCASFCRHVTRSRAPCPLVSQRKGDAVRFQAAIAMRHAMSRTSLASRRHRRPDPDSPSRSLTLTYPLPP